MRARLTTLTGFEVIRQMTLILRGCVHDHIHRGVCLICKRMSCKSSVTCLRRERRQVRSSVAVPVRRKAPHGIQHHALPPVRAAIVSGQPLHTVTARQRAQFLLPVVIARLPEKLDMIRTSLLYS